MGKGRIGTAFIYTSWVILFHSMAEQSLKKTLLEDRIGQDTLELYDEHTLWFSYTSPRSGNDSEVDSILSR